MINEVVFIIDQHLLSGDRGRRIARHDVVVVKTNNLGGATQRFTGLAVPDGKQYVTV